MVTSLSGFKIDAYCRHLHDMPAGVSWPTYLKFAVAAGLSMVAGAQTVHAVYRPLDDLETVIKKFEEAEKATQDISKK